MKYFAYCRKSSEGEERQALSIPAQIDEIKRVFGVATDVEIVEWFEEKMSAKAPGRPIWNSMIKRIEAGGADGIIAWHPDRLARNSVDGGWIIHLLDRRVLKDLKFVSYSYEQSPQGMFMLQIMFGQSKYYVDNLSVNVKRGMRKKIEMGWLPNMAPLGYRNDRETGTITVDPERFPLLRRMWDLLLTGAYSVQQINTIANGEWGFRTPVRKKSGGRPFSLSGTYRMFVNPFYAGILDWYGGWKPGKHRQMVTLEEFERAQTILRRRPGMPKPETLRFAYTGLIHCSCGLSVTAEQKTKPSGRRYTYYHCTRRAHPRCAEPAVRVEVIEKHIERYLRRLRIPEHIEDALQKKLGGSAAELNAQRERRLASAKTALEQVRRELRTLTDVRVRNLIDDDEFMERRKALQQRELTLEEAARAGTDNLSMMLELGQALLLLSNYAADWFLDGDLDDKRLIAKSLCSNSVLSGRMLSVQARFPMTATPPPANFLRQRGVVETLGTLAQQKDEAQRFIETVNCLKQRAEARRAGMPVPDFPPTILLPRRSPAGRAAWRAPDKRAA